MTTHYRLWRIDKERYSNNSVQSVVCNGLEGNDKKESGRLSQTSQLIRVFFPLLMPTLERLISFEQVRDKRMLNTTLKPGVQHSVEVPEFTKDFYGFGISSGFSLPTARCCDQSLQRAKTLKSWIVLVRLILQP